MVKIRWPYRLIEHEHENVTVVTKNNTNLFMNFIK